MNANLYSQLYQTLKNGKGAVLIRIIRREGSAPRGVGSACIVDGDGTLFGTIGGGLLEYRAIEKAKVLLEKRVTSLITVKMTAKEIEEEGMICGGMVELFFEPIFPEEDVVEFFRNIDELFHGDGGGTLVTVVRDEVDALAPGKRMLVKKDGSVIGTIPLVKLPEHVIQSRLVEAEGICVLDAGDVFYTEKVKGEIVRIRNGVRELYMTGLYKPGYLYCDEETASIWITEDRRNFGRLLHSRAPNEYTIVATGLKSPQSIAFSSADSFLLAEQGKDRVLRFDRKAPFDSRLNLPFLNPALN
jgi:hypothetical protein